MPDQDFTQNHSPQNSENPSFVTENQENDSFLHSGALQVLTNCLLILLTAALGFSLFWHYRENNLDKRSVKALIAQEFLFSAPSDQKYKEGELKGVVDSLEDPYSQYLTKEEVEKNQDNLNRRYEGIGVQFDFQKEKERLFVEKVFKNSPAERMGVQEGDWLLSVEGEKVSDLNTEEIIQKIRGPEGSSVSLEFQREGEVLQLQIPRQKIITELVELEVRGKVGIIRLSSFGENLDAKMAAVVGQIRANAQISSLILDLRSNGGGLLDEALEVTSYFVPSDQVIVQEKFKDKTETLKTKSKNPNLLDYPVIVLTDGGTASASEIMAGALREYRGAKIVGQKTFGKGVVQRSFGLKNGDQVKLTIAQWLTGKGQEIDKKGLEPDTKISDEQDALEIALGQI